jgi:hypothetical protein
VALERFVHDPDRAFAVPVFANRRADANQQPGARIAGFLVVDRPREPKGEEGRRFDLEGEVGDHVLHQRLVDQRLLERAASGRVMDGLGEGPTHQARGAEGEIEPRQMRHGECRLDALSLFADKPAERAAVLDLARRVRFVAALVLEALDQQTIARAVG